MKFTKEFLLMVAAGHSRSCAEIAPIIRKCARVGAVKSNALTHADDVEQELWIFLIKNVDRLDEDYNIEPYLIETARNISLSYNRRYAFLATGDGEPSHNDGISGLDGAEVSSAEEALDTLINRASMSQAMEYLLSRSPRLRAAANEQHTEEDEMKTTTTGKKEREPSPEMEELRRIRNTLHYSQPEMAEKIGVKLPTYQAYEYGKTNKIADDVMERARKLLQDTDYSYIQTLYAGKTMADIAGEWATRLGLKYGDVSPLARLLGCNKSTVSRWYDDKGKPNTWDIVRYEAIVAQQEKRMLAAMKAVH